MNRPILAQVAALGAMGLALLVALADRPCDRNATASAWPLLVEEGADHIRPQELAERMLAMPDSVRLVDVRPAAEFSDFHLPGAVNLDVAALLGAPGRELLASSPSQLVVLYSNGMTHPAQAWVELARRGHDNVRVLEDGLEGFVREVLTPPSLRPARTEERAKREQPAFAAAAALCIPHATHGAPPPSDTRAAPQVADRREGPFASLATDPPELAEPTLVSAEWVAQRGTALVLLDAREKPEEYAAGHLPGALHVPIQLLRRERDGVPDELRTRDELAALFGSLGIDGRTEVVAYGDAKLQDPAHLALALIHVGHRRVAILEGGLKAWTATGRGLSSEAAGPKATTFVPQRETDLRIATLDDVRAASGGGSVRVLDVRPADAFRGDVSTEARAGHIPGSLSRPYTADIVSTDAGVYWRRPEDLLREYEALGLDRTQPLIVSCRTGHQAAQTWFLLRYVLGYQAVSWYDGSWKEWAARSELPIETGSASP